MPGTFSTLCKSVPSNCTTILAVFVVTTTGCSARSDFMKASDLDTLEAYQQFLDEHPTEQKYAPQARERLEALSFEETLQQDTFAGYVKFLKQFPHGVHAQRAERRAEEIHAEELGIHLYRRQPDDFYAWVDTRRLPYRILVRSSNPDTEGTRRIERKWYSELVRRGLFVPMDPQKTYPVSPDLTLYVRETVIILYAYPLALVEAEIRVSGTTVKTYRVAGTHIEKYLLYEIFKDQHVYGPLFRTPTEEIQAVEERFEQRRKTLPLKSSLALEFETPQQAPDWDHEMIRTFVEFLRALPLSENFEAYPRGRPPRRVESRRLYLSVHPEIHSPRVHKHWSSAGSSMDWSAWNTRWILQERDYFFKKMTLDILDLLETPDSALSRSHRGKHPARG